jgi:hypothetical protein
MSAAAELLDRLAAIGATIEPKGDHLLLRAGTEAVPAELVRRVRDLKRDVLAALTRAQRASTPVNRDRMDTAEAWSWHEWQAARIVHWFGGGHPWDESQRLAFGELILAWHGRHGALPDPGRCAGCDDEFPGEGGLVVDRDGARVHFDGSRGVHCIIAFGRRWRGAAVAGLRALGLDPPEAFELL